LVLAGSAVGIIVNQFVEQQLISSRVSCDTSCSAFSDAWQTIKIKAVLIKLYGEKYYKFRDGKNYNNKMLYDEKLLLSC
jgi:hypothetical protein